MQESIAQVGTVFPPIQGASPASVPGEFELTQALTGPIDNGSFLTRGFDTSLPNLNNANTANNTQVQVGSPGGVIPAAQLRSSGK